MTVAAKRSDGTIPLTGALADDDAWIDLKHQGFAIVPVARDRVALLACNVVASLVITGSGADGLYVRTQQCVFAVIREDDGVTVSVANVDVSATGPSEFWGMGGGHVSDGGSTTSGESPIGPSIISVMPALRLRAVASSDSGSPERFGVKIQARCDLVEVGAVVVRVKCDVRPVEV